jgi:hypothetical protein
MASGVQNSTRSISAQLVIGLKQIDVQIPLKFDGPRSPRGFLIPAVPPPAAASNHLDDIQEAPEDSNQKDLPHLPNVAPSPVRLHGLARSVEPRSYQAGSYRCGDSAFGCLLLYLIDACVVDYPAVG